MIAQPPATDPLPHLFERLRADRRQETGKNRSVAVYRLPGSETKSQKGKLNLRVAPSSPTVSAASNSGLFRMQFQPTSYESLFQFSFQSLSPFPRSTMTDNVICVSLEKYIGLIATHPAIKSIMQKQVGQQRTDHPSLRRAYQSFFKATVN